MSRFQVFPNITRMGARRSVTKAIVGAFAALALAATAGCASSTSNEPSPTGSGNTSMSAAKDVRIIAFGDSGTGDANQMAVAEALSRAGHVDGVIHTGDVIYMDGDVSLIPERVDAPYRELLKTARWAVAPGNHDLTNGNASELLSHFGDPVTPYHVQMGPVSVYVFDSFHDQQAQVVWLNKLVQNDTSAFKVAVAHAPAQSCSRHGSDEQTLSVLEPALEMAHFDMFLSGHDHNYQRFVPLGGVTHIVTGGGGAGLYELTACPSGVERAVGVVAWHYLDITADSSELSVKAIALDGSIIDSFTLKRK